MEKIQNSLQILQKYSRQILVIMAICEHMDGYMGRTITFWPENLQAENDTHNQIVVWTINHMKNVLL